MYKIMSSFYGQISVAETIEDAERKIHIYEINHGYTGEKFSIEYKNIGKKGIYEKK